MDAIIIETQQKGLFVIKEIDINGFLSDVYKLFEEDDFVSEYLDMKTDLDDKYYFSRRIIAFKDNKANKKQFFNSEFMAIHNKIVHFAFEHGLMEKGVYISKI